MTLQDYEHYLEEYHIYRENVLSSDIILTQIRNVLFSFFGVKTRTAEEQLASLQEKGFAVQKVPGNIITAWEKAGFKGTLDEFAKSYKQKD